MYLVDESPRKRLCPKDPINLPNSRVEAPGLCPYSSPVDRLGNRIRFLENAPLVFCAEAPPFGLEQDFGIGRLDLPVVRLEFWDFVVRHRFPPPPFYTH